ncbi:hypothetical protein BC826DRAFT_994272 [Russula brevipes]|nr:hypothetical protein BC826DRAFT_994272 [Russula brevipes]
MEILIFIQMFSMFSPGNRIRSYHAEHGATRRQTPSIPSHAGQHKRSVVPLPLRQNKRRAFPPRRFHKSESPNLTCALSERWIRWDASVRLRGHRKSKSPTVRRSHRRGRGEAHPDNGVTRAAPGRATTSAPRPTGIYWIITNPPSMRPGKSALGAYKRQSEKELARRTINLRTRNPTQRQRQSTKTMFLKIGAVVV